MISHSLEKILFICPIRKKLSWHLNIFLTVFPVKIPAAELLNARLPECLPVLAILYLKKLDANLAKAVLSVGAVKGFEIGDGFTAACAMGSEHNDSFCSETTESGPKISKRTNHSGGVLGGMSDGSTICFRAAVKPDAIYFTSAEDSHCIR